MFYYVSILAITLSYFNGAVVVEHSVTGPFNTFEKCQIYKTGVDQYFTEIVDIEVKVSECRTKKPMA